MNDDDWIGQAEMEERIKEAGEVTLNRLHLLVQRGYRPDFGEPFGAIWLYHPRESFKHSELTLYGDGMVISPPGQPDQHCISREETAEFDRFLHAVPRPTFWDRTRHGRIEVYTWLCLCSVMFGGWIAAWAVYEFAKALFR